LEFGAVPNARRPASGLVLTEAAPRFLGLAEVELGFAPQTIAKYEECLRLVARWVGDLPVTELSK